METNNRLWFSFSQLYTHNTNFSLLSTVLETHRISKGFMLNASLFYLFYIYIWKDRIRMNQIKLQRWSEVRGSRMLSY